MAILSRDLLVIGSGPAGHGGAMAAARLGKSVAVVERKGSAGGPALQAASLPSKALRQAVLSLSRPPAPVPGSSPPAPLPDDLLPLLRERVRVVVEREREAARAVLRAHGVTILEGAARFVDARTVEVTPAVGAPTLVRVGTVLVACGSRPATSPDFPLDGVRTFTSSDLLRLDRLPGELLIVGGGVVGLEIASSLTALGVPVTVVEQSPLLLPVADREVVQILSEALRRRGVTLRLGEKVTRVTFLRDGRVRAAVEGGRSLHAEALLLAVGRQGNADMIAPEKAGLAVDSRGRLAVDADFRTGVPGVLAAGDVIGFPSLASVSREQGRVAVERAFGLESSYRLERLPIAIYTLPEAAMVGWTEEALAGHVPYEVGLAHFSDLPKGRIQGSAEGMLKLLFDRTDHRLLGVHVVGEGAAELIHVGQMAMELGGTVDALASAPFATPTFAEAYRVAARNGLDRL